MLILGSATKFLFARSVMHSWVPWVEKRLLSRSCCLSENCCWIYIFRYLSVLKRIIYPLESKSIIFIISQKFEVTQGWGGGGGGTPRKIGWGCAACFPKSAIFPSLLMTWLLNQNPVSDQRHNKFPSSDFCRSRRTETQNRCNSATLLMQSWLCSQRSYQSISILVQNESI